LNPFRKCQSGSWRLEAFAHDRAKRFVELGIPKIKADLLEHSRPDALTKEQHLPRLQGAESELER
jgi:hypothetical protein